jgi:hypothetical protein
MTLGRPKFCCVGLVLALAGAMLAGCNSNPSTPAAASPSAGDTYTSKVLTTSHAGALNASNQLMLGMLKLEGTDNAITAEQAKSMLLVMQSLQGQMLKSDAERNAVWANIEKQLAPVQLNAIVNMQLTQNDLQTWTQNNNQGPGAGPGQGGTGPQGTPGAGPGQGGVRPQGTPGARPGQGGARPQGTPGAPPAFGAAAGGAGAASGQSNVLLSALIRLLASKSAGAAAPTPAPAVTPLPTPTKT